MWGYGPYGGMGYGWGPGGWMMLFGGLVWILVLLAAVAAIVWLVRAPWHAGHGVPPRPEKTSSGLEILEERYARGELERDEFLQKKRDLLGRGAA
jgi:putative membrane protein